MKSVNKKLVGSLLGLAVVLGALAVGIKIMSEKNESMSKTGGSEYVKYSFECKNGKDVKGPVVDQINVSLAKENLRKVPSTDVTVCAHGDADTFEAVVMTSDCTATSCTNAVVALITSTQSSQTIRILAKYPTSELFGSSLLGSLKEWTSRSVTFVVNGAPQEGGCDAAMLKSTYVNKTVTVDLASGTQHVDETCFQRSCSDTTQVCK